MGNYGEGAAARLIPMLPDGSTEWERSELPELDAVVYVKPGFDETSVRTAISVASHGLIRYSPPAQWFKSGNNVQVAQLDDEREFSIAAPGNSVYENALRSVGIGMSGVGIDNHRYNSLFEIDPVTGRYVAATKFDAFKYTPPDWLQT